MRKPANKLPNRLWKLIDLAVADMRALRKTKKYAVNMDVWHAPDADKGVCRVCLAGAIIAGELAPERYMKSFFNGDFSRDTSKKLKALDSLREGYIDNAVDYFYGGTSRKKRIEKSIKALGADPEGTCEWRFEGELNGPQLRKFYATMTKVARQLEAVDI